MNYKIGLDIMGGDKSPIVLFKGLIDFLKENKTKNERIIIYLTKEIYEEIKKLIVKYNIEFVISENYIEPKDEAFVIRRKPSSSLALAIKDIANGKIETIISPCNTKALVTSGSVFLKRLTKAPIAFASLLPKKNGGQFFFLDAGAKVNYVINDFVSLAIYGMVAARILLKKENPSIRLVNIGTESNKGDELHVEADKLLAEKFPHNYKGNIDSYSFMNHEDDVLITDGFTGNIMAKAFEGGVELVSSILKGLAVNSIKNKVALLVLKKDIKKEIFRFDYRSRGAAYILGLEKLLFKVHGRSDNVAVKNALQTTFDIIDDQLITKIKEELDKNNE